MSLQLCSVVECEDGLSGCFFTPARDVLEGVFHQLFGMVFYSYERWAQEFFHPSWCFYVSLSGLFMV